LVLHFKKKLKVTYKHIKSFAKGILNSYAQVFFSDNLLFAAILLASTFIHINSGIAGISAVIITNVFALLTGLDKRNTEAGYYGFNSLLVGLGLGLFFLPTFSFFVLLFFVSLLTLFLTVAFSGILGKYSLPFLSLPFLFSFWIAVLATRGYRAIELSQTGFDMVQDLFSHDNSRLLATIEQCNNNQFCASLVTYLKSLGAIFFEYNIVAGILIALGLLIYSRIAFCLSLIGFYSAFFFYKFIGGNITELTYSYIGFNFILSSIAIGGFFIIPSKYSYLWVMVLTPLIVILTSGFTVLLNTYQLPVYSLPFNVIVIVFLYVLKFRTKLTNKLQLVTVQQNSPEKNLYSWLNHADRFGKFALVSIRLPFISKWFVSQGQNGKITHKDGWKHAWDFVITDDKKKSYNPPGNSTEDYYCYNKPVVAPADGYIVELTNIADDNTIGDVDINQNWGNTVVIKHSEYLYSKLSHLKKDSFRVKTGDFVKRGETIANCGNSGRSPEPHVHFQLQSTPFIGSGTMDYPICHYIVENESGYDLKFNERPKEGEIISNIEKNELLSQAFHFIPGQKLHFVVNHNRRKLPEMVEWEVITDIYNQACLYEKHTESYAWLFNDGEVFYFNNFSGNKKSLLYYFYLAAYRVPLGYYQGLIVRDNYRLDIIAHKIMLPFQDFVAPFFRFVNAGFRLVYNKIEKDFITNYIELESTAEVKYFGRTTRKIEFSIDIQNKNIHKFIIRFNQVHIEASCTDQTLY
jgi:urea transporter